MIKDTDIVPVLSSVINSLQATCWDAANVKCGNKPLVRAAGSQPSQQTIVFSRWEPAEPANHCFQPLGASEASKPLFSTAGSQRSQQIIVFSRWEPAKSANHCFQPLGASEASKPLF
ncbi:MAG: hypothetical protein ACTTK2_00820 [Hoylesella marshii]|uniref:hypothetical protein n=1 Tax=Hoylesella marshii TaxID=189722 RepID=UPI003FA04B27